MKAMSIDENENATNNIKSAAENKKRANEFKEKGNGFVKTKKYESASEYQVK
jgi:hypothetical protein